MEFQFPRKRALFSVPFSGMLIPSSHLSKLREYDTLKGDWVESTKGRSCWLCGMVLALSADKCPTCARPAKPDWLMLPTGFLGAGTAVDVRLKRTSDGENEATSEPYGAGIVTTVDYGKKRVGIHVKGLPDAKGAIELEVLWIEHTQLSSGMIVIVDDSDPRALALQNFFLCGKCGKSSGFNGSMPFIDDATIADIKGRMRLLWQDIEKAESQLVCYTKKWKERKTEYEKYVSAKEQVNEMKRQHAHLKSQVDPLQLWCPHCGWKWTN